MMSNDPRRRARFAALLVTTLLGAAAGPAHAQASNEDESRSLFVRGRELQKEGHCDQAVEKFRRAYELLPSGLGALRNLATCEESLGKLASARRHWFELRTAVQRSGDPKYKGWDVEADASFARLEARVPRMKVVVTGVDVNDPRVRVTIDGAVFDPRLVGEELERDVGTYHVEATTTASGHALADVELAAGARRTIELTLPALPRSDPPPPPIAKPDPARVVDPRPQDAPRSHAPAVVAFVLGGAFAAGSIASFAVEASALSKIESSCPSHAGCDPSLASVRDRALVTRAIGWGAAGAAAVAVGVGVGLWVSESSHRSASARVELGPGGVLVRGTF